MTTPRIDYRALFAVTPSPYLVLDPDLVVVEVNEAYLRVTGRTRDELIGHELFEVHPDNPGDPEADGVRNLGASLRRVLRSKEPESMAVQRYDLPVSGRPGVFQERWWSPINTPVLGPDGEVAWIIHRVEDMTEFLQTRAPAAGPEGDPGGKWTLEAELYARAQELQLLNEKLREAHEWERRTALALQRAMLHTPDLEAHHGIAVRYMPAARSLNVCGDWYDVVDLSEDTFTVAVGDVVGHGLEAAAVMGMLRSALSAAVRALHEPGKAMDVLSRYARSAEGALATTAAKAVIDTRRQSTGGTAPCSCSTGPPTRRSACSPRRHPAPRPWSRTRRATHSSCTPTVSSSAGVRTSTPACTASWTRSPVTPASARTIWPTRSSAASAWPTADATTSP